MLTLTYLSHSSYLLDDGSFQLLIDPFISGNSNAPVKTEDLNPEFIALTHGHGDHIGDAIEIAKSNNSLIIAVNELANYCSESGAKAHNMHIGGAHNFDFGKLKFTIAHHGSSTNEGRYLGPAAGLLISMGGKTIYHAGDTGLFLDMKLIGELDDISLMLAPIGDNFTMGIDDAVTAAKFVNPALVSPMHYDTFPAIEANPMEFKTKVESLGIGCLVLEYGETIEV